MRHSQLGECLEQWTFHILQDILQDMDKKNDVE